MQIHNKTTIKGYLTIKTFKDGELIRESGPIPNKVVSSDTYGRNLILRQLTGDTTYPIVIDSVAFGDDDGTILPIADSNTALGNSLVTGISITDTTITNDELEIDVFVADASLADDDYKEIGFFCNGRLFSRIIISPTYTKATGEDTLFTYTITLSG